MNNGQRIGLPEELKNGCVMYLPGEVSSGSKRLADTSFYSDANLVRYYTMDDLTEKNGNTLTNVGCTTTTGKFGGAYSSGTGNTTKWMQNSTLTGINGGACTISAWIKVNGTQPSDYSCAVNENCPQTSPYVGNFIQFATNNNVVYFSRLRNIVAWERATYYWNVPIGEWHYYTYTFDGGTVRGYVDGVLRTSTGAGGSGGYDGNRWQGVNIFAEPYSPSTEGFSGDIDDVAFFTRALGDSEVASLYGQMVASDASGSGNNGTLVNSPTVTRGGLWGYKGLTFNGTSQSVTVPNVANVRSFTAILVPTANNKTILNLGGSNVISLNSSNQIATAGLTGVTIYVNGSSVNLLNLNAPNVVTVNFDAVTLSSASLANSSFAGKIANATLRTEVVDFGNHRDAFNSFFAP